MGRETVSQTVSFYIREVVIRVHKHREISVVTYLISCLLVTQHQILKYVSDTIEYLGFKLKEVTKLECVEFVIVCGLQ